MQTPVQIAFHGLDCSEATRELIEEKVAWLERFCDRIIGCRVVVETPHRHRRQGNQFLVRIDLTVPGAEIVVNREPGQRTLSRDLNVAIGHAFDAARRRLEEQSRRLRQDVKSHAPIPSARVSRLFPEEDYGFLRTPDDREVYFHRNAVLNGEFSHLQLGSEVTFVEELGEKGPQASTVRPVGRHNHH
jgi:ribosomal subunit interface protein